MTTTPDTNDQKAVAMKRFDLLYDQLKATRSATIDGVFKATAALLVVGGWVATSESSRKVLSGDRVMRWLSAICIIAYAVLYVFALSRGVRSSRQTARLLGSLNYIPYTDYESLVLSVRTAVVFMLVNSLLSGTIAVNVLRAR
jgi:hypothetical protein